MSNMNSMILWVYIVFLVIGGVIGFVKAQSKPSLIASLLFGTLLALGASGIVTFRYWTEALLVLLALVFGARLVKTRKFMPAGMMEVATILVLVLRFAL